MLAINATLGLAVEVDPTEFAIRRSVTFEPSAAGGITLAKFGHQPSGPVGRRVVAAPDGSAVYAAGPGGIVSIDPNDLHVTARFLEGTGVEAIAVTPDGGTIYALMAAEGTDRQARRRVGGDPRPRPERRLRPASGHRPLLMADRVVPSNRSGTA